VISLKAEIIAVGTEILLGDIVNTNAQYLAQRLASLGVNVFHQSVIGDNAERLKEELKLSFDRSDIVITTGGLGPTQDDLTKETGAEFFGKKMILHEESLRWIEDYFKKLNKAMNEGNKKQSYFPEGSIILPNSHGTAPGCIIEESKKILIVLPGPPREMKPMFEDSVVPYLKKFQENILVSKALRICGIPEGHMAEKISDIIESGKNPTIAPYAKEGEVTLRITASAKSEEEALNLIKPAEDKIRGRLGENVYGTGDTSLEEVIGKLLLSKKLTISTAESCTGGMLAARLINYPGISAVFMDGAVTYSNEAKIKRLGVKKETLKKYGAVSKETAMEMAEGIAKTSGTDIGISTTGIAGPGGGTLEKPVGLVYIGLCINGRTIFKELNCPGDRQMVRSRTVTTALDMLRRELL
jgi:nicotinamide-nucleotide amidase